MSSEFIEAEEEEAAEAYERAQAEFRRGRVLLAVIVLASLLVGIGSVVWLIRNVVPRIRSYSAFAARASAGELGQRLEPREHDEIADLGRALDEMVARREAERRSDVAQDEFSEMLQVTEGEDEAHDLLKRQLERSIAGSTAVVLNRNNSADRLEPTTALPKDSELREGLQDAEPRSCLAVRFGRLHEEGMLRDPLVSCDVCGKRSPFSTCEPLLVGGEVIGSVLVQHQQPLAPRERASISASVSQAAPVLANLRSLALAEFRAATDALTGLPNSRAVQDTLKRMVAQASRTVTPLALLLLDLDHFKQINDTYGHGGGDDVLAAVGAALESTLRESDFVGRYGGEEFLILLPSTSRQEALIAAEKLRAAIASIKVASVDRAITGSIGVAVLPDDAGDTSTLLRHADRALYSAKAQGRNRVEAAIPPGVEAAVTT